MDISKLEEAKQFVLESIKTGYIKSDEYERIKNSMVMSNEEEANEKIEKQHFKIYSLMKSNPYKYNYPEEIQNFCKLNLIAYYTSNIGYFKKASYLDVMKKGMVVKRYKRVPKGFKLTDYDGNDIKITLISKRIPHILELFPKLISFSGREGCCHINSILLSQCLSNDNTFVVTGNIKSLDNQVLLHSWIETIATETRQPLVLDFNTNAIFDKEDYYKLRQPEVITEVSKEDLKKFLDKKIAFRDDALLDGLAAKELLLFFDDIVVLADELQANQQQKCK